MAKINTTNYQPVSAWNGTQDLLIVEQPDGTKVATPEQVKQYVEAGDFEATGEVIDGHGNILNDVVNEIGDLSQTGLTGDSVAAQLADVDTALAKKTEYYFSAGAGSTQTFNIEIEVNNRCYLFSAGYVGRSTLEFIAISSSGEISHVSLVNNNLTITAISFVKETGAVTITLSNNPYCHGRLTKLC